MGWGVTFLGVFILNVDIGLYIGVATSIVIIILKSQRARVSLLGNIPQTSIFECIETCNDVNTNKITKPISTLNNILFKFFN